MVGGIGRKRPLDDNDGDDGDDQNNDRLNKWCKYDCDRPVKLPSDERNITSNMNDKKKCNSLPVLVQELLALLKKSPNTDDDDDNDDDKTNLKNISVGVEEQKLNVMPNQTSEEEQRNEFLLKNEYPKQDCENVKIPSINLERLNTIQSNTRIELDTLDSAIKNYTKNLHELDFIINGKKTVYMDTKSTLVDNIKGNVVGKNNISFGVEEKKLNVLHNTDNLIADGSNSRMEVDSAVQNQKKFDRFINGTKNVQNKRTLDTKSTTLVASNKKKNIISFGVQKEKVNVLHNTDNLIADRSNNKMELDSDVQNKKTLDTKFTTVVAKKKKKNKYKKKRSKKKTTSTKRISVMKNVPENSAQENNLSYTGNLFLSPKKENLLTLLKKHCINGISESCLPISKPPPCNCTFCMQVDNLPIKQRMVNNLYVSDNGSKLNYNYKNCMTINPTIYDSNFTVSDCSVCASNYIYTTNDCFCVNYSSFKNFSDKTSPIMEHSKQTWVNDLRFLIEKNKSLKASNTTYHSSESSLVPSKNTIHKVYKSAKRILCRFCKHSNYSCQCNSRRTERNISDFLPYGYNGNYRSGRLD